MTPHQAVKASTIYLAVTIPLAGVLLAAWVFRFIPDTRPFVMLMLYLTMLLAIVLGVLVRVMAQLHVATVEAFAAGYRTATHDMAEGAAPAQRQLRSVPPPHN